MMSAKENGLHWINVAQETFFFFLQKTLGRSATGGWSRKIPVRGIT
jgi:hypothetical protein